MAQPVPFQDHNAPFRSQPQQQRQRPTTHQPSPGFNAFMNPNSNNNRTTPQFHSQQQQPSMHQQQATPQFYQGSTSSQDGYYTPQQQHHEYRQPQQQFQSAPVFQQPNNNFAFDDNQVYQPSPPNSHPGQIPLHPSQHQRHPHAHPQQPDFINQLAGNPMAGLAMNTAQDFLHKQSELYLPGAYGIWGSLKYYFTVNNTYVKSRLKTLLLPFWHKNWRRIGPTQRDETKTTQFAPPSRDMNAPDLYIPLMGFLTFILIAGYSKGASNQFSPDVIGKDASYCLVMQLIEIGILAACLYLLNSSVSFLDLVSFSGYKYIPLVINSVAYQLFGSVAYYVALLYTGVAVSYFTLNCMKGSVSEPTPENRAFRNYLLFGVSCLQLVLVCWISYTTAPRE